MRLVGDLRPALALAGALILSVAALAAVPAYDRQRFESLLAEGKPVILHFSAEWCPTCKAQQPVAAAVLEQPRFRGVAFFRADYDAEKELEHRYGVTYRSTFIVFKNGKEVGRSTGKVDRATIEALFAQAL
jgi:thiol-disulfide isomerase/thioredoxin